MTSYLSIDVICKTNVVCVSTKIGKSCLLYSWINVYVNFMLGVTIWQYFSTCQFSYEKYFSETFTKANKPQIFSLVFSFLCLDEISFAFLCLSHVAKICWVGYLTKITLLCQWKYKCSDCWSFKDRLYVVVNFFTKNQLIQYFAKLHSFKKIFLFYLEWHISWQENRQQEI